jgi:hypothetical protein
MGLVEQASNIGYALRNNKFDVTDTCTVIDLYETLLSCIGYLQAIAENENISFIKEGQYHVNLPELYRKEYMIK